MPKNKYLPSANQNQVEKQKVMEIRGAMYMGPLPPANQLAEYNNLLPGLAERLVQRMEKQSDHRMYLEKKVVHSDIVKSYVGQVSSFLISTSVIFLGYKLIVTGHDTAGFATIIGSLASLVGVFFIGKKKHEKSLQERKES